MSEWELVDKLYLKGYVDGQNERDYDPRGCKEWQDILDRIETLKNSLRNIVNAEDPREMYEIALDSLEGES